ncbi:putative quinol monooxygenase [Bdellovibrio sp. HCB185ZH]|uniref:putative quinol monooxygenase n=1 Tax=Bdellovibrio sp. HCB185ZH TaxID=3394235 RepID=UPI0039A4775D
MIVMTSKIQVKAERERDFVGLAAIVVHPARADKGCMSYEFFEDPLEPGVFMIIETWKSWEDLNAHLEKDYTKEFFAKLPKFAVIPPTITTYESRGGQPMTL